METKDLSTSENMLDAGRRTIERKALLKTVKEIFSYRNPIRQFWEDYRFNVIRWNASNLRKPSVRKRIGLLFETRSPLEILRHNFRQNRSDLLAEWERCVIGDINRSLIELGGIPLGNKPRDLNKRISDVDKKLTRMGSYDRCPDMLREILLLSTYKYIFASPYDRKFGGLCPDDICEMLCRNGVPSESLSFQNYESILNGRDTVTYEYTSDEKNALYLKPLDHVKLEITPQGYDMVPTGPPSLRTLPASTEFKNDPERLSEKTKKPKKGKTPSKKSEKSKRKGQKMR